MNNEITKKINMILEHIEGCTFAINNVKDTCIKTEADMIDAYVDLIKDILDGKTDPRIGKVCWFWDFYMDNKRIGVLEKIDYSDNGPRFIMKHGLAYAHCEAVKKDEVEFV